MGTGKLAAQVAHASVLGVEKIKTKHPDIFNKWYNEGQAKIVLKVHSLEKLLDIAKKAEYEGIVVALVHDSGLT